MDYFFFFFKGYYSGSDLYLSISPVQLHCAKTISMEVTESKASFTNTQKWVHGPNADQSAVILSPVCPWPGDCAGAGAGPAPARCWGAAAAFWGRGDIAALLVCTGLSLYEPALSNSHPLGSFGLQRVP